MKKKSSPTQNKEIDEVTAQMAEALTRVNQEEKQGHAGTYWHEKLERLSSRLADIQSIENENVDDTEE